MKDAGDVMNILEAYDLVGSYRAAAEIADCDDHTVKLHVQRRAAGLAPGDGVRRSSIIDGFRPKVEELVERSKGPIRADVVHDKLVATCSPTPPHMKCPGRTTGTRRSDRSRQRR